MAGIVNKVKKRSDIYRIEDTTTKESLISEIERSVKTETEIKESVEKIKATADSTQVRLDNLMDSSKEGSIQKMIDSEISEIVNTSPSNLESLRNISEWFEEDETGAASLINAVNQSSQDVEKIKNSTVYLTKDEYDDLVKTGKVESDVEYNIYEDEE